MNERIKELAQQALFESDFDDEQNIYITMEMFAELIVRECVQVSLKNSHRDDDMGAIIARQMLKQFGVES